MNATTPAEFAQLGFFGVFKKSGSEEWHGPCPMCGGVDRFIVWTDRPFPGWRWMCRKCNPKGGWIDELKPELKTLDPKERLRLAAIAEKEAKERAIREYQRWQEALAELRSAKSWVKYHDQMTEWARHKWESWGIPKWYQDYWQLGYSPDFLYFCNECEHHSPTMTIPIFEQKTWEIVNIKHRLLEPSSPTDKYRPEMRHIPAALYITEPDLDLSGKVFVVEGEKKAMVSFITLDNPDMQVVGLPGKNLKPELLSKFSESSLIYLCLDPDATREALDLAEQIGKHKCRLIELPGKIDDLIIDYKLTKNWMRKIMRQAVKV